MMTAKTGVITTAIFIFSFLSTVGFPICIFAASSSVPMDSGDDPGWQLSSTWWRRGEVDLREQARDRYERGKYRQAARTYGRMANLATSPVNAAWATMRKGEMNIAAGRLTRAAEAYREAIEKWPGEINFQSAMERLREIAEAFAAEPGSALWIIPVERTRQAIETYEFIVEQAPGGRQAVNDLMRLAELQLQDRKADAAMASLRQVFSRHPDSGRAPEARWQYLQLLLEKADQQQDVPALLETGHREARLFLRFHPRHELAEDVRSLITGIEQRLAVHYLELADFYLHPVRRNPAAARHYLRKVIDRYGETEAAGQARQRLASLPDRSDADMDTGHGQPQNSDNEAGDNVGSRPQSAVSGVAAVTTPGGNPATAATDLLRAEERLLPGFASLAVRSVRNLTREPELGTVMRHQLHEAIMREETVDLENSRQSDLLLEIRVDDFRLESAATARIRQETDLPDTLSSHATTLFTAVIKVDYRVLGPDHTELVGWRQVQGTADFPQMPDMAMARETALRQAATDTAGRLINQIVEAR